MIDINFLRQPELLDKLLSSEKRRFRTAENVEACIELDKQLIKTQYTIDRTKQKLNEKNTEIKNFYKNLKKPGNENKKEDLEIFIQDKNKLTEEIKELENKLTNLKNEFEPKFRQIGNILDEKVITSKNEDDNEIVSSNDIKYNIDCPIIPHNYIMEKMDGVEFERGAKLVGHRGYFIKNDIALLEQSISRYAIDFIRDQQKNATYIQTPVFMKKEIMEKTCQLSEFDDQLYSVGDSHYLIATSEQPISGLYMDERLEKTELPKYFVGDSLCFRKEAGAHGKDNLGIFRVHQFHKIEQFVICDPSESTKYHETMIRHTENFLKTLGFNTRTVSIVSGEMNDAASIKYDIEAFFPEQKLFRELASISNCTDYQSRDLNIRLGATKQNNKKVYVHMLNGTLCAVQRLMCGLLEVHQCEGGVKVPEVLQKYVGKAFLEYRK